jgi:hypothetical protein
MIYAIGMVGGASVSYQDKALSSSLLRLLICLLFLAPCVVTPPTVTKAQGQRSRATTFRRFEPNAYAPDLYADHLKLKLTLINLPGAVEAGSYWEVSYRIFFISEAEVQAVTEETRKRLAPNGGSFSWNPNPSMFPGKILLAQGNFKRRNLATLTDRTYIQDRILFKSRIPDKQRTKFATLMTSFSVKLYDARLKTTVYESSAWQTNPFDDDAAQPDRAAPRQILYANFFLSPQGQLFKSQWPRNGDSTNWP